MDESLQENCRLCNYRSDKRLMLSVFEEPASYAEKIESYLNFKVYQDDRNSSFICFHCSQTLDNFHNYASKIKNIQKIIFPNQQFQIHEISYETSTYEICVIPSAGNDEADKIEILQTERVDTTNCKLPQPFKEEDSDSEAPNEDDETIQIPTKLLENGLLIYKGKELMAMMSQFFNTSCEICEIHFRRIGELFRHQKTQHKITPYISCCSTKLSKIPGIIWHFVRHIEPEAFKCNICSYSVSRPKFLEQHLQTHSDPSEKQFSCDKCNKRFIWKGALRAHLLNHQSERRNFQCTICQRKYLSSGSLSWHKKTAHGPESKEKRKNLCEICSKTFATLTSYKEHKLTHSEDSEKLQLCCPQCGKWLKNQRCLKSHMLLHTENDLQCTLCNYTTKKENLLKNHIITRHTSDRPWSCEECGKTFKVKRALTVHKVQNHTDGAKTGRTCEFCNKTFGSSTNYYTHRKNLHAEELKKILDEKDELKKLQRIKIGLEAPAQK